MRRNRQISKFRYLAMAGAAAASLGSGLALSGVAGAITVTSPVVCAACRPSLPVAGPAILEAGSVSMTGGIVPDWFVTGYGYSANLNWTVNVENASTHQVYDSTTASSQNNGTIAAYSPVNAPAQPGVLSFTAGRPVHPIPLCGVTLQAFLTNSGVTGSTEVVTLPACPPPPPPPR